MQFQTDADEAGLDNFQMVLVNYDNDAEKMAAYMEKSKITFPGFNAREITDNMASDVGGTGYLPCIVIVSPEGEVQTNDRAEALAHIAATIEEGK